MATLEPPAMRNVSRLPSKWSAKFPMTLVMSVSVTPVDVISLIVVTSR